MATGWFFNSPAASIKRDNMKEWLLWALFSTNRDGQKEEWTEELEGYLTRLEEYMGRKLERGWNSGAKCMKLTLDPVVMVHRPLVWYTVCYITGRTSGFKLTTSSNRLWRQWTPSLASICWCKALRTSAAGTRLFVSLLGGFPCSHSDLHVPKLLIGIVRIVQRPNHQCCSFTVLGYVSLPTHSTPPLLTMRRLVCGHMSHSSVKLLPRIPM